MKVIGDIKEVMALDRQLANFILAACPYVSEDWWDPTSIGFIFVLDDDDSHKVRSICTVPHVPDSEGDYRNSMTIDLESFDLYEPPAIYDSATNYWNVVAVFGQEYGCAIFLSAGFVASLPTLKAKLESMQSKEQ